MHDIIRELKKLFDDGGTIQEEGAVNSDNITPKFALGKSRKCSENNQETRFTLI